MQEIVDVHYPGIKQKLVAEALRIFYDMRKVPGLKKKPSTSELLDWLKLLMVEDIDEPTRWREKDPTKLIPPLHGALLKNEQDVHLFERLAFLARREELRGAARTSRLARRPQILEARRVGGTVMRGVVGFYSPVWSPRPRRPWPPSRLAPIGCFEASASRSPSRRSLDEPTRLG